jgi:hypothetical protein
MVLLHIEHSVMDFASWKAAFDSDPVGRKRSGVRRYRVLRPVGNPNYAIIDLEFDSPGEAEALLEAMKKIWSGVGGKLIQEPNWQISEIVETQSY